MPHKAALEGNLYNIGSKGAIIIHGAEVKLTGKLALHGCLIIDLQHPLIFHVPQALHTIFDDIGLPIIPKFQAAPGPRLRYSNGYIG